MSSFFPVIIVLACLMVLGVLFIGLIGMAKGGEFNKKYGNKLMRMRVALQLLAVVLVAIAFLVHKSG